MHFHAKFTFVNRTQLIAKNNAFDIWFPSSGRPLLAPPALGIKKQQKKEKKNIEKLSSFAQSFLFFCYEANWKIQDS